MRWGLVSFKNEPRRWSKPCGLVQLIIQDHPDEQIPSMRFTAEVVINGRSFCKTYHRSERTAKSHATLRARIVLQASLASVVAKPRKKWMGP